MSERAPFRTATGNAPASARMTPPASSRHTAAMRPRPARLAALTLPAATLALSAAAHGDGTLPGDARLARWLQAHPTPLAGPLTDATNRLASGAPLTVLGVALALALLAARRRDAALLVALATALRAVNPLLKTLVESPRPTADAVRVAERAHGLGFPSGHAMGATLVLGAAAILLTRSSASLSSGDAPPSSPPLPGGEWSGVRVSRRDGTAMRRSAIALCLALILLTGYGRVLVGAHWPSDVLGGWLWGGCLLALAVRATDTVVIRGGPAGRRRP